MIGDAILFGIKRIDALRGDGHDSLVGPSPLVDLRAKEGYSLKDFLLVIFHTQFSTCFKSAVEAIRVNGEDPFKTATHKELTQIGTIRSISAFLSRLLNIYSIKKCRHSLIPASFYYSFSYSSCFAKIRDSVRQIFD